MPSVTDTLPPFELERYFAGKTEAWGVFLDRFGKLRRRFTVAMSGEVTDGVLTLTEDFRYDNGTVEHRVWTIRRDGADGYVAEADGLVGSAQGRRHGSAVNWRYAMRLNVGGSKLKVAFDDWLYLHADEVVVNRAKVSKFGIKLGDVMLFFQRPSRSAARARS